MVAVNRRKTREIAAWDKRVNLVDVYTRDEVLISTKRYTLAIAK